MTIDIKMRELDTIQKCRKANRVYATDRPAPADGNVNYEYLIAYPKNADWLRLYLGSEQSPNFPNGVMDADLLEIVRDRLKGFQSGKYSSREKAGALTHIEEALMLLNREVEKRTK